jgi:hypothetical protein
MNTRVHLNKPVDDQAKAIQFYDVQRQIIKVGVTGWRPEAQFNPV